MHADTTSCLDDMPSSRKDTWRLVAVISSRYRLVSRDSVFRPGMSFTLYVVCFVIFNS